ncbi:DUF1294 domain-containing protein [Antarctobacter heliothermus]|nr:DUF1294 domain-containing protein [Antarctobacter heliothermus]
MTDRVVLILTCVGLAVLVNALAFVLFGLDKRRARRGVWRVPERNLLILAALGGSVGAKLGQRVFRHKTSKQPFAGTLNAICLMQAVAVVAMVIPASRQWILSGLTGVSG